MSIPTIPRLTLAGLRKAAGGINEEKLGQFRPGLVLRRDKA